MSSSAGATVASPYWCYRCRRSVRVRAGDLVVCPRCETGFVELLLGAPPTPPSPSATRHRRDPNTAMYAVNGPSMDAAPSRPRHHADAGSRRSRHNRAVFNPVIVLRGPSEVGGGEGEVGRVAPTFELYYDGGAVSGLRPLPAIMSEFLMGSDFAHLLEQMEHMGTNTAGGRDPAHPPASKAAVEAMPTVEIAEGHVGLDAHCAVCKDPFELGAAAREMPCTHIFHQDCILPWLSQRNSCPVCRHEMPTDVGATGPHGDEAAPAGGGEEDRVGLTIWRLPSGGFAVGRFAGGRRAGGRELPVVYTEVDGGFDTHGAPRRTSSSSRGSRSRGSGRIGRAFRSFFSCVGLSLGSSSTSSSLATSAEYGSSSRGNRPGSVLVRSSRRRNHG